jgi:hypothetical protein
MREEATKQFFARQQKARPSTATPPQSQEPMGYGASPSPLSASDDMDSSFAISRKGLLKNAKPFYQSMFMCCNPSIDRRRMIF